MQSYIMTQIQLFCDAPFLFIHLWIKFIWEQARQ